MYVSWREVVKASIHVASLVKKNGFKPDAIVAILKGGVIPARIMADLLRVGEIGFIGVKFYKKPCVHDAKPELTTPLTISVRGKRILIVDDVVETSRSMQLVIDELGRYGAGTVKTATLYVKQWSSMFPDYYYLVVDKWLVFPWEIVETTLSGVNIFDYVKEDLDLLSLISAEFLDKPVVEKKGDREDH